MIRALFVSDIHITSPEDPKFRAFAEFLDLCASRLIPEHLFLVGDVFDVWLSDREYFVRQYQPLIDRLMRLKQLGTEIHYFEGNHDLDLRIFFQNRLGFDVRIEAAYFKIGNYHLRVEHGDQMDPEDQGYLFLRWLFRTPVLVFLQRYLPNAMVAWLGRRVSRASREYTSTIKTVSPEIIRERMRLHALKAHAQAPFDVLVAGHVHVLEDSVHQTETGSVRCINLGTWLTEPNVLVLDDELRLLPLKALGQNV